MASWFMDSVTLNYVLIFHKKNCIRYIWEPLPEEGNGQNYRCAHIWQKLLPFEDRDPDPRRQQVQQHRKTSQEICKVGLHPLHWVQAKPHQSDVKTLHVFPFLGHRRGCCSLSSLSRWRNGHFSFLNSLPKGILWRTFHIHCNNICGSRLIHRRWAPKIPLKRLDWK